MTERNIVISVIDGQGGKIGREIVDKCKREFGDSVTVIALGTNAVATSAMMKGGADRGATGENAIVYNVGKSSFIIGAIGIAMPNSMCGEVTMKISEAIGESNAIKILVPIDRCGIRLAMPKLDTVSKFIDYAVTIVKEYVDSRTGSTRKRLYMVSEG